MFFVFLKGLFSKRPFLKAKVNIPFLNRFSIKTPHHPVSKQCIIDYPKLTFENLTEQDNYDLQWYVIGPSYDFISDKPKKITIWDKDYVVWKNGRSNFFALDDACSHKGVSLSDGKIQNGNIVCPYHGYEFDCNGELKKVPGICFQPSSVQNLSKYKVVEKHGWVRTVSLIIHKY
jgi:nitrite reductase/ring-hydroxylating ferredoxin subunit